MIIDLIFPIECYGCGKKGVYLCQECCQKIPVLTRLVCPKCGKASPFGLIHPNCRSKFTNLDGLVSLYSYHSLVGKLIKDYKYQPAQKLNRALVKLIVQGLLKNKKWINFLKNKNFTFLPVPLYYLKKLSRGFDQSAEILIKVAGDLGLTYSNKLLIRQKWTKQQAKLNKKQRRNNVRLAFKVKKKANLENKNFVLFDDVWTTGSTINSASSALAQAGANKIWALTICR